MQCNVINKSYFVGATNSFLSSLKKFFNRLEKKKIKTKRRMRRSDVAKKILGLK